MEELRASNNAAFAREIDHPITPPLIASMKTTLVVAAFLLAGSLFAADATTVLLMGAKESSAGTYTATKAVVGDMSIHADSITYDQQAGVLQCHGVVVIQSEGSVVKAADCVVQLSGRPAVYMLNPNGITVSPAPTASGSPGRDAPGSFGSGQTPRQTLPSGRSRGDIE